MMFAARRLFTQQFAGKRLLSTATAEATEAVGSSGKKAFVALAGQGFLGIGVAIVLNPLFCWFADDYMFRTPGAGADLNSWSKMVNCFVRQAQGFDVVFSLMPLSWAWDTASSRHKLSSPRKRRKLKSFFPLCMMSILINELLDCCVDRQSSYFSVSSSPDNWMAVVFILAAALFRMLCCALALERS